MKIFIIAGLVMLGIACINSASSASSAQLQNVKVCEFQTIEDYAGMVLARGAFEHELSEADVKLMLSNYQGYRNYTTVRLFTTKWSRTGSRSRHGMFVFGNAHGCAIFNMPRTLIWISELFERDIVHPE